MNKTTRYRVFKGASYRDVNPYVGNSLTPEPPDHSDFWYFMTVGIVLGLTLTTLFSLPSFFCGY